MLNNIVPWWENTFDEINQQRVKQTIDLVPEGIHSVLDVGCGNGAVSNSLVSKSKALFGIDINVEALRYFQGKGVVASASQIPFIDKSFDIVICAEVLEHLPIDVYEKALIEIERVAKYYIIITTPNEEYLPSNFTKCQYCGCIYHANFHLRTFNNVKHVNLFQEFELVNTVGIGCWKQHPLLTWIEQNLFGIYKFKSDLICPCCCYKSTKKPTIGFLKRATLKGIRLLGKYFPKRSKSRWIASLYRHKDLNKIDS